MCALFYSSFYNIVPQAGKRTDYQPHVNGYKVYGLLTLIASPWIACSIITRSGNKIAKITLVTDIVGWRRSFPSCNFILIPSSISNFIAESPSEILIYPNPEHEFEFYAILTRVFFILSQIF